MDQNNHENEKLSLDGFLEMYKRGNVFAISTDQKTQAYVIWIESEDRADDKFYTHPACDEASIEDYMSFMIELRRLRFDRYDNRRTIQKEK